jgi:hypothetical protein
MKKLLILATAMLAGCAADCGPDWREIGLRDGSLGAGSQAERYAARCTTKVDTAAYEQGYREGFAMRPRVPYP